MNLKSSYGACVEVLMTNLKVILIKLNPLSTFFNLMCPTQVLQRAKLKSKHAFFKLIQLRGAEFIFKMPDKRLPKRLLFGDLEKDKRFFES